MGSNQIVGLLAALPELLSPPFKPSSPAAFTGLAEGQPTLPPNPSQGLSYHTLLCWFLQP